MRHLLLFGLLLSYFRFTVLLQVPQRNLDKFL